MAVRTSEAEWRGDLRRNRPTSKALAGPTIALRAALAS
jgi:hypothetical protein